MKNLNVAVREWQDEVVFLHKIVEGAADKSYGIHVARLAGVPREVIERAKEILAQLEEEHLDAEGRAKIAAPPGRRRNAMATFNCAFRPGGASAAGRAAKSGSGQMTPREALRLLGQWQECARCGETTVRRVGGSDAMPSGEERWGRAC